MGLTRIALIFGVGYALGRPEGKAKRCWPPPTGAMLRTFPTTRAVPADLAIIGEVGLSGELRAVSHLGTRMREAAKLGFKRCLIPKTSRRSDPLPGGIEAIQVRSLVDALRYAIPMDKKDREKE